MGDYPDGLYRLWQTQGDANTELLIQKGLEQALVTVIQKKSGVIGKLKALGTSDHLEPKWPTEYSYPHEITALMSPVVGATATITFSGYLFNEAIDGAYVEKVITTDTILRKMTAGVPIMIQIDNVNGLTATGHAYGGTTLAIDAAATTYDIIGTPYSDDRAADTPRALERFLRHCGTHKFSETFIIEEDAKNQALEIISDPVEHELTALTTKMSEDMAIAVINDVPYYDGTAYRSGLWTKKPTMWGLVSWPAIVQAERANTNIYASLSGAELRKSHLDTLAYYLARDEGADFKAQNYAVIVHPSTRRYMNRFHISFRDMTYDNKTVGTEVDYIKLDNGSTVPIVDDWYWPRTSIMMAPLSECGWGYFKNDKPRRGKLSLDTIRSEKWQLTFQTYGVKVKNPRQLGYIYYAKDYTG